MISKITNIQIDSRNKYKNSLKKKTVSDSASAIPPAVPSFTCSISTRPMELTEAINLIKTKLKNSQSVLQRIKPHGKIENISLVLDYTSDKQVELLLSHMGTKDNRFMAEIPLSKGTKETVTNLLNSEYLEPGIDNILRKELDKIEKLTNDAI